MLEITIDENKIKWLNAKFYSKLKCQISGNS